MLLGYKAKVSTQNMEAMNKKETFGTISADTNDVTINHKADISDVIKRPDSCTVHVNNNNIFRPWELGTTDVLSTSEFYICVVLSSLNNVTLSS